MESQDWSCKKTLHSMEGVDIALKEAAFSSLLHRNSATYQFNTDAFGQKKFAFNLSVHSSVIRAFSPQNTTRLSKRDLFLLIFGNQIRRFMKLSSKLGTFKKSMTLGLRLYTVSSATGRVVVQTRLFS